MDSSQRIGQFISSLNLTTVVLAAAWGLGLMDTSILIVQAAPKVSHHNHHRHLQQDLILLEDTLWDTPGDDNVLLGLGERIVVFSNVTLTIRGTSEQPIRIVYDYHHWYQFSWSSPTPPAILLYPDATLILEHVHLEHLPVHGRFDGAPAAIQMDGQSTVRMNHVHCRSLLRCVMEADETTSGTGRGSLVVKDSVFANHSRAVFRGEIETNITTSLFVNNAAITETGYRNGPLSFHRSFFLNNSNRVFDAEQITDCWFLNNTGGAIAPIWSYPYRRVTIANCVFYGNTQAAVAISSRATADNTVLTNLTFFDNGIAIRASSETFDATRLNILQSTEYNFVSNKRTTMDIPDLYWGEPSTTSSIQSTIHDARTGNSDAGLVNIEPIATRPFTHDLLHEQLESSDRSEFPPSIQLPTTFQGLPLSAYQQNDGNYSSLGINETLPDRIEWEPVVTAPACECTCPAATTFPAPSEANSSSTTTATPSPPPSEAINTNVQGNSTSTLVPTIATSTSPSTSAPFFSSLPPTSSTKSPQVATGTPSAVAASIEQQDDHASQEQAATGAVPRQNSLPSATPTTEQPVPTPAGALPGELNMASSRASASATATTKLVGGVAWFVTSLILC